MWRRRIAIALTASCLLLLTACAARTVYQAPVDDLARCAPEALFRPPVREIHGSLLEQEKRAYGDYILDSAECNAALRFAEQRLEQLKHWSEINGCGREQ